MKRFIVLFTFILIGALVQGSCTKDPEVITETVYVTDTVYVYHTDTIEVEKLIKDTATTFILVRHAEKEDSGSDPGLSAEGVERAEKLKETLSKISLSGIYSTDYRRTIETANPTANDKGLEVKIYDPFNLTSSASDILNSNRHQTVLVIGHSNTTPAFANYLLDENKLQQFSEDDYGNILILNVIKPGEAELIQLRY